MLQSKRAKRKNLHESLLHEGGDGLAGLSAANLAKLNQQNYDNSDAGNSSYQGSDAPKERKMARSRLSDETHIEGLEQFNKYGDLF